MIILKNEKNQMKSTRLHLAKGIKLIQRLQKSKPLFFFILEPSFSSLELSPNYHREASDSAIDDAEGIEHWFAWCYIGRTRDIRSEREDEVERRGVEGETFIFL